MNKINNKNNNNNLNNNNLNNNNKAPVYSVKPVNRPPFSVLLKPNKAKVLFSEAVLLSLKI